MQRSPKSLRQSSRPAPHRPKAPRPSSIETFIAACRRFLSKPETGGAGAKPSAAKGIRAKVADLFVRRYGESEGTYFRTNRLFNVGTEWFFATREGENQGPFPDREQAEVALAVFIAEHLLERDERPDPAENEAMTALDEMVAEALDVMQVLKEQSHSSAGVWVHKRLARLQGTMHGTGFPRRRIDVIEYLLDTA